MKIGGFIPWYVYLAIIVVILLFRVIEGWYERRNSSIMRKRVNRGSDPFLVNDNKYWRRRY